EVGITLPKLSPETVDQFLIALDQVVTGLNEADITGFADTFAGQLQKLQLGFRAFGTDAQGQFDGVVGLLTGPNGAKGIFDALKGLDITSEEGGAKARQILQDLFLGFEDLSKGDLGGLNPQQLLDSIFT